MSGVPATKPVFLCFYLEADTRTNDNQKERARRAPTIGETLVDGKALNLEELQRFVLDELESYRYEVPEGALGRPHSDAWVERQLAEMRAALVTPEWRVVRQNDTPEEPPGMPELRRCVLVADDRDAYQLYYDPLEEDFVLAFSGNPPDTFGVRGDAVGCFMAR